MSPRTATAAGGIATTSSRRYPSRRPAALAARGAIAAFAKSNHPQSTLDSARTTVKTTSRLRRTATTATKTAASATTARKATRTNAKWTAATTTTISSAVCSSSLEPASSAATTMILAPQQQDNDDECSTLPTEKDIQNHRKERNHHASTTATRRDIHTSSTSRRPTRFAVATTKYTTATTTTALADVAALITSTATTSCQTNRRKGKVTESTMRRTLPVLQFDRMVADLQQTQAYMAAAACRRCRHLQESEQALIRMYEAQQQYSDRFQQQQPAHKKLKTVREDEPVDDLNRNSDNAKILSHSKQQPSPELAHKNNDEVEPNEPILPEEVVQDMDGGRKPAFATAVPVDAAIKSSQTLAPPAQSSPAKNHPAPTVKPLIEQQQQQQQKQKNPFVSNPPIAANASLEGRNEGDDPASMGVVDQDYNNGKAPAAGQNKNKQKKNNKKKISLSEQPTPSELKNNVPTMMMDISMEMATANPVIENISPIESKPTKSALNAVPLFRQKIMARSSPSPFKRIQSAFKNALVSTSVPGGIVKKPRPMAASASANATSKVSLAAQADCGGESSSSSSSSLSFHRGDDTHDHDDDDAIMNDDDVVEPAQEHREGSINQSFSSSRSSKVEMIEMADDGSEEQKRAVTMDFASVQEPRRKMDSSLSNSRLLKVERIEAAEEVVEEQKNALQLEKSFSSARSPPNAMVDNPPVDDAVKEANLDFVSTTIRESSALSSFTKLPSPPKVSYLVDEFELPAASHQPTSSGNNQKITTSLAPPPSRQGRFKPPLLVNNNSTNELADIKQPRKAVGVFENSTVTMTTSMKIMGKENDELQPTADDDNMDVTYDAPCGGWQPAVGILHKAASDKNANKMVSEVPSLSSSSSSSSSRPCTSTAVGGPLSSSHHKAGSSILQSEEFKNRKEQKMARIQEMREKSKPVVLTTKPMQASEKYIKTINSLNTLSSTTTATSAPSQKHELAAKMRAKALEAAAAAAVPSSALTTQVSSQQTESTWSSKPLVAASVAPVGAQKSAFAVAAWQQPPSSTKPSKVGFKQVLPPAVPQPPAPSPRDSYQYEISDREDSDSECESDDEEQRNSKKKRIPEWATSKNLKAAAMRQFTLGIDSDEIFDPTTMQTCDLDELFADLHTKYKVKKNYRSRRDTGDWSRDGLTMPEVVAYKRAMRIGPYRDAQHQQQSELTQCGGGGERLA